MIEACNHLCAFSIGQPLVMNLTVGACIANAFVWKGPTAGLLAKGVRRKVRSKKLIRILSKAVTKETKRSKELKKDKKRTFQLDEVFFRKLVEDTVTYPQ